MANVYIGPRIRQERKKRGWKQTEVAKTLGIKRSQNYANYEYGLREPDADMISRLAALYGVSSDYLIGITDNPYQTYDDLLASLELSDKEIRDTFEFMVDGKAVTEDEQMNMIAFIRTKRMVTTV